MKSVRVFLANMGFCTHVMPCVIPPLGIMTLAAYLRERVDATIRIVNQRLDNCPCEEIVRQAAEFKTDVVGLSSLTTGAYLLPELVTSIRQALPRALVVLGGPHVSAIGSAALDKIEAHAAVVGEGERPFEQIVQAYLDGGDLGAIPGLIWRDPTGAVRRNPGMIPLIEDLDTLPRPAYDLIDLPPYWRRQPPLRCQVIDA